MNYAKLQVIDVSDQSTLWNRLSNNRQYTDSAVIFCNDNVSEEKDLKSYIRCVATMSAARSMMLVSIPKYELESLEATIETLENDYVMSQLEKSEKDIIDGRVRNVKEFVKKL